VLCQDESGTCRTLRGDAGVAFPVYFIEAVRDACRHPLLKAFRCPAKRGAPQPRMVRPKRRELRPHGAVNHTEQIPGQHRVGLEAEEHITRNRPVPCHPNLAVAEPGDRSDAAIDRPSLPAYRSSRRPTISAAAIASASVQPLETVFSASALIRALTLVISVVCIKLRLIPDSRPTPSGRPIDLKRAQPVDSGDRHIQCQVPFRY